MYGFDFRPMIYALLVIGAAFVALIWGVCEFIDDDSIRSETIITPRIELTIENNIVDTIYIYEKQ